MKIEKIGGIDKGIDGADIYVSFQLEGQEKEEFENPEDWSDLVKGHMVNMYWQDCGGPGQQFCQDIRVMPVQYTDDKFIGIAMIRYDI